MKRLIAISLLFFVLLAACKKEEEDKDFPCEEEEQKGQTVLDISSMTLALDNDGNTKTFSIISNGEWTITNNSSWCKTNKTYGKGNAVVNVMAFPYDEYDDRNTNLTIKAGNKTKVITITQKKKDALLLTEEKYVVEQTGDTITVEVKSNVNYSVTIPNLYQDWIKEVKGTATKALVTDKKHFEISPNTEETKREGIIVFKDNDSSLADTVHVYQSEYKELVIVQKNYTLTCLATTLSVELRTNIDYDVIIPTGAQEWITHLDTRAIRTDYVSLSIAKNETQYDREAEIVIKDKNSTLSDTLHIRQIQKRTLVLGKKLIYVEAKGGEVSVELTTDVDYKVTIPYSASNWISIISTKSIRTERLTFFVAAHESSDSRRVEIVIQDRNSALNDTLVIEQVTKGAYVGNVILETEQDLIDFYEAGYQQIYGDVLIKIDDYKITTLRQLGNQVAIIHGSLTIDCHPVKTFEGLGGLQEITGSLILKAGGMESFEQLQNLKTIGGNFELLNDGFGWLYLSSFKGLENLVNIGGSFKISSDAQKLISFRGLNGLQRIKGDFEISSVIALLNLSSFKGLEKLESIGGCFKISSQSAKLTSFQGLNTLKSIGGNFEMDNLRALSSFEGLENLENIDGCFKLLHFQSLNALTSFRGLSNLKSIGRDFELAASLDALSSFEGLENLERIGGSLKLHSSSYQFLNSLTSFRGLNALKSIEGDFEISSSIHYLSLQALSSFEGLENLENIGGSFILSSYSSLNDLTSFRGLNNLKRIDENFTITISSIPDASYSSMETLSSFEGLENLETIGGHFQINAYSTDNSTALKSLAFFRGLSGLKNIEGDFYITSSAYSNSSGTTASSLDALSSFEGLGNLENIGGNFQVLAISNCNSITSSYHATALKTLTSFRGLNKLRRIGGNLWVGTTSSTGSNSSSLEALSSFDGLENLESIGGFLTVSGCPFLTNFCALKKVIKNIDSDNYFINTNAYNPTKEQILNGKCSQ